MTAFKTLQLLLFDLEKVIFQQTMHQPLLNKKIKTILIHKKKSKCFNYLQEFVVFMTDAFLSKFNKIYEENWAR